MPFHRSIENFIVIVHRFWDNWMYADNVRQTFYDALTRERAHGGHVEAVRISFM